MKKSRSTSKSKVSKKAQAAIDAQRALVAQQEARGNFDTYDHDKLQRLLKAAGIDEVNK